MPKIKPLSRSERRREYFTKWLRGKKAQEKVNNIAISDRLSISEQSVSFKNRRGSYSYLELVELFDTLHATDEEILKLMKYERAEI
jgi:hypothetical protein